jgi:hypothetical protein
MHSVCPQPSVWADIHQLLQQKWEAAGRLGEPPPFPLILAGWIYSSDLDKQSRWQMTVDWAVSNGYAELVNSISDDQFYKTSYLTTSYPQQHYNLHSGPPVPKPDKETVSAAFCKLCDSWDSIAGSKLASICRPKKFAGRKFRKLIVTVTSNDTPPWGAWNYFTLGCDKNAFTHFRRHINEAITPLHVDHVEFDILV